MDSVALAAETRAALLNAQPIEGRATDVKSISKSANSETFRLQFTACCGAMDVENRREMDQASDGEVPTLPSSVRQREN